MSTSDASQTLGVQTDQVVQEVGWDDDCDEGLRAAVAGACESELLDEDSDEMVDVVLLWWREDDGDLVDALSMRDIYVSAGSACSRGTLSHVLKSAGYEASLVEGALRISFDAQNTTEEIDTLLQALKDLILK